MCERVYLGVDIGTSGCKVCAFDAHGRPCGFARREYNVRMLPGGGAELDSEEVMQLCFEAIREVTASGVPAVRAMGISSQGEAFVALDHEGKALCNAMVSSDFRAQPYVETGLCGLPVERLYAITGHTPHPMFTLYKLLWLKSNRPDIWEKAWKVLCFEDLLQYRLGLDPAMGWPLAGRTMLFDVTRHCWDTEILAFLGLDGSRLARPLASGSVAGVVRADVAAALGLPDGVKVVTGGHDQACGALGAGITEAGTAMYATGTVECIAPAFDRAVFSDELMRSNLCTYDHTAPGLYTTVAFNLTGGNALKWFRDEFGQVERKAAEQGGGSAYERLITLAGGKPSGLLWLPYLTPSGTPYFDTQTPGAVIGMRMSTSRGEFLRALLEGVVFEMRLNLEILNTAGCRIQNLRIIGGGAKSVSWNRLRADVLNLPVTTLDVNEAGCLGVAMLAACAAGEQGGCLSSLAKEWIRTGETVQPDPANAAYYRRRFETYKALYPAVSKLSLSERSEFSLG